MTSQFLRPGRNVWRVERAQRAAVLVDAAAFYQAVREACLKACRSILIVGWDIDSRTKLIGADPEPADGYPVELSAFLTKLVEERPQLQIQLLLWDYSLLYAGEREMFPRLSLQWRTPPNVTLCLDHTVPFGSSQHQKMVIVDDSVAFSGGLDLTIRRWDTCDHRAVNPLRVDPGGKPYRPFHDVQMVVDGDAARALAELARRRWCRANGGEPEIAPCGDPWPQSAVPDFRDVRVGIARTQPRCAGTKAVREVEALFLDSIDRAERRIYIENQFVTSPDIARRLARQLRRKPKLEVVVVAPRSHDSMVERHTMRNGRIRFWRTLRKAGGERVRLVYPSVVQDGETTDTMIHSKIMVVDDAFLRVGSANLNNRSMGADTECDLAVEASSDEERAAIVALRNRLFGEHCGVDADAVADALAESESLARAADSLSRDGHSLQRIEDGEPDDNRLVDLIERIADPARPLRLGRILGGVLSRRDRSRNGPAISAPRVGHAGLLVFALAALAVGLALAWRFTDLSEWASPAGVGEFLNDRADGPWTLPAMLAAFLVAGLVGFPVTVLIVATAAAFGPWLGALYSSLGVMASALALFWIGALFGQDAMARLIGRRWDALSARLRRRGLLAVVALRVLPVAPFTLVNLAAGASSIRLADYALGTLLGMAPGLLAISALGDRIVATISNPTAGRIGLLILCVAAWIGVSFAAQALVARLSEKAA